LLSADRSAPARFSDRPSEVEPVKESVLGVVVSIGAGAFVNEASDVAPRLAR
jgi:hypothetical protein